MLHCLRNLLTFQPSLKKIIIISIFPNNYDPHHFQSFFYFHRHNLQCHVTLFPPSTFCSNFFCSIDYFNSLKRAFTNDNGRKREGKKKIILFSWILILFHFINKFWFISTIQKIIHKWLHTFNEFFCSWMDVLKSGLSTSS